MARTRRRLLTALLGFVAAGSAGARAAAADEEALWRALARGGHVLMVRHALAPGTGDPGNFTLGDCSTQRNLSAAGRAEARALGAALRRRGVQVGPVLASEWCRCRDTAALAFGSYEAWPALNSFFGDRTPQAEQTAAVIARAQGLGVGRNLVLVTHQVNITAVSGVFPQPSEIVVLRPAAGALEVVGRLRPVP